MEERDAQVTRGDVVYGCVMLAVLFLFAAVASVVIYALLSI